MEPEVNTETTGETLAGAASGTETDDTIHTVVDSAVGDNDAKIVPADDPISSGAQTVQTLDNADLADLIDDHAAAMTGFNPDIHAVGPDGQPIKRPDGTFAKKRGRKPGGKNSVSENARNALPPKTANNTGAPLPGVDSSQTFSGTSTTSGTSEKISSEATAKMCANLTFAVGTMIFGPELAKPQNKDEANSIKNAYKDYFDARGTPDLPPEIGLLFAIGAYAAPRLQHETMAEKVGRWVGTARGWIFRSPAKLEKTTAQNPQPVSAAPATPRNPVAWGS